MNPTGSHDRPGGVLHSSPIPTMQCGRFSLEMRKPLIMGIVNLTHDSFSGDGLAGAPDFVAYAYRQAQRMQEEGADILDIGAESTRPGADPVSLEEELARVIPVVRALHPLNIPLSVDTSKPEVMAAAIAAGADMINDVQALSAPGALAAVADSRVALCLMHMQGQPRTMQHAPRYDNVLAEVLAFLRARLLDTLAAGIAQERISVDPGFGFGKSVAHNYSLLAQLKSFQQLGVPVLVGMSRKSMLGAVTGRPVEERLVAGIAASVLAMERGAAILRVHDVKETLDARLVWENMKAGETTDCNLPPT